MPGLTAVMPRIRNQCRGYGCAVTKSWTNLCSPMDHSPPGSSVHGTLPGKNTGVRCHFLLQGTFPTCGLTQVCCLAGGFFTTEPPGKPSTQCEAMFTKPNGCTFSPMDGHRAGPGLERITIIRTFSSMLPIKNPII